MKIYSIFFVVHKLQEKERDCRLKSFPPSNDFNRQPRQAYSPDSLLMNFLAMIAYSNGFATAGSCSASTTTQPS